MQLTQPLAESAQCGVVLEHFRGPGCAGHMIHDDPAVARIARTDGRSQARARRTVVADDLLLEIRAGQHRPATDAQHAGIPRWIRQLQAQVHLSPPWQRDGSPGAIRERPPGAIGYQIAEALERYCFSHDTNPATETNK